MEQETHSVADVRLGILRVDLRGLTVEWSPMKAQKLGWRRSGLSKCRGGRRQMVDRLLEADI